MTKPAHADEHDALMVMLAKQVETSRLIAGAILITVGVDGRPCVGANMDDPAAIMRILRELGAAEQHVEHVTEVDVPNTQ